MTTRLIFFLCLFTANVNTTVAQQDRPFPNEIQQISFGELLGMAGSCSLNYEDGLITDGGGSLCPAPDDKFGEPGKYQIVATPFTNVQIKVTGKPNSGDGISYTPDGVYRVSGEPDTAIIAAQDQVIYSGNTGVITILLGGTLVSSVSQSFNSSFSLTIEDGITFNEVP